MSRGARCYCVTVHSEEGEPLRLLDASLWPHVTFLVYQRELGGRTAAEHFQAYIELDGAVRFTTLQETCPGLESAHFESRRGTQTHAIRYCVKPDVYKGDFVPDDTRIEGPWWWGEPKHQGARADLLEIQRDIRSGTSLKRIADDHFPEWVRFGKSFKDYKRICAVPRDFKSTVIVLVGPPGRGKSRFAHLLCKYLSLEGRCDELTFPELGYHPEFNPVVRGVQLSTERDYRYSVYKVPDKHSGFWCDDYDSQTVFFMDEFDGDRMRPKAFNDLCDRYECVVPAHGGAGSQMVSPYIVICSNYAPKYWWKKRSEMQLLQTTRRIDGLIKLIPETGPQRVVVYEQETGQFIHKII